MFPSDAHHALHYGWGHRDCPRRKTQVAGENRWCWCSLAFHTPHAEEEATAEEEGSSSTSSSLLAPRRCLLLLRRRRRRRRIVSSWSSVSRCDYLFAEIRTRVGGCNKHKNFHLISWSIFDLHEDNEYFLYSNTSLQIYKSIHPRTHTVCLPLPPFTPLPIWLTHLHISYPRALSSALRAEALLGRPPAAPPPSPALLCCEEAAFLFLHHTQNVKNKANTINDAVREIREILNI